MRHSRVREDTYEMYLIYRYMRGCIFRYFRYRCHFKKLAENVS